MSANSGIEGICRVCGHANNEHNTARCPDRRCRRRWKRCQVNSHPCKTKNGQPRLCYSCGNPDHARLFYALEWDTHYGQNDIRKVQETNRRRHGITGGDSDTYTSGGSGSESGHGSAGGSQYHRGGPVPMSGAGYLLPGPMPMSGHHHSSHRPHQPAYPVAYPAQPSPYAQAPHSPYAQAPLSPYAQMPHSPYAQAPRSPYAQAPHSGGFFRSK